MRILTPGRSKQSHLVVATKNVHLFVWAPGWTGADSTGVTFRWRREVDWHHLRLIVMQRNTQDRSRHRTRHTKRGGQRFAIRPTLTLVELAAWKTRNGTTERDDMKRYLRVKVCPGGRRIA